jgi:hypothetical protein
MQPNALMPRLNRDGQIIIPIVSGNLSTSDGADIINIPRLSNATDNALVINVGGDANALACESNLTFDGSQLGIAGDLSASAGAQFGSDVVVGGGVQLSASSAYLNWGGTTGSVGYGIRDNAGTIQYKNAGEEWINVSNSAGVSYPATGPVGSLQIQVGSGEFSGSSELVFASNVLQVNGGLKLNRIHTSASLTASTSDYYIGVNTAASPVSISLPNAGALQDGQTYVVKDEGGSAATHNVTIIASGSQTIDSQNSVILESPYASIHLYCNGLDKYYIC